MTEQQKNIWLRSCDSAMHWMKAPTEITINNEKHLNSAQSDWGVPVNLMEINTEGNERSPALDEANNFYLPLTKSPNTQATYLQTERVV